MFKTPILTATSEVFVRLPPPRRVGAASLEETLQLRRSVRDYSSAPLALADLAQISWAALGTTIGGRRTVPSAGALYPLELYIVAGKVDGLPAGVYRYLPTDHALVCISSGDHRRALCSAALGQACVENAAVDLVIAAVPIRTTTKYAGRGIRYVHMESGHASQNVYLQAASLGLGVVAVGAFKDEEVRRVLTLPEVTIPLYIMPVGNL